MKSCRECNHSMKKLKVKVEDAENQVDSYQCTNCNYFEFEKNSSKKIIKELREKESVLKIKQNIIKLSKGRLGIYINSDIARCLDLKSGQEIYTSVPDKKTIILSIKE